MMNNNKIGPVDLFLLWGDIYNNSLFSDKQIESDGKKQKLCL